VETEPTIASTSHAAAMENISAVPISDERPHVPEATTARPSSNHPMITRAKDNIFKPKTHHDGTIKNPLPRALIAENSHMTQEPTCYTEAIKHPHWREAMNVEFDALLHNGTWSLVAPSSHQNVVGCKWVFRVKRKADGSIERYKARLVAKGYHQHQGVDFHETYSPVIKPTTVRTVLSIAVSSGWCLRQFDIQNAFLHGFLDEQVFMIQPPGFSHPQMPNHVCHLRKALYGLKQAPRAWFSRLSNSLLALGFISSKADTSLFIYRQGNLVIYFLIYVDDIIVTGSNTAAVNLIITKLNADFAVKDLGDLHFFLGIEALPVSNGLYLTQRKYTADLLIRSKMSLAKPSSTPMSSICKLSAYTGEIFEDPTLYRSIVGGLQYLSFTRPDIAFSVNRVCQFMHKLLLPH